MSRSTVARSRAEKGGKGATSATPAITQEIIPGKYNDHDWNVMLDHDDGDDVSFDVMSGLVNTVMDVIFQNNIQKQLVPYTVMQAKDAILQIIEWQFLARDVGEKDVETDAGWIEDEEPPPVATDCWAQGSVPRTLLSARTPRPITEDIPEEQEPGVEQEDQQTQLPSEETMEAEEAEEGVQEETEAGDSVPAEESDVHEQLLPLQDQQVQPEAGEEKEGTTTTTEDQKPASGDLGPKKKKKFKPHGGRLRSAGISAMTTSLDQTEMALLQQECTPAQAMSPDFALLAMPASCQSIVKLQGGRPPGNRDVVYDEFGNVVAMTKIDPDRLPSHKVRTGFKVVDPAAEAAQAQLEAMRTGRYLQAKKAPKPPAEAKLSATRSGAVRFSPRSHTTHATAKTSVSTTQPFGHSKDGVTPLPPPLIECMEVSPGVIVREGERVKRGPRQRPKQADLIAAATQRGLRPLTIKGNLPLLSVADLLDQQTPVLRPIVSPPIPPISHHRPIHS